MEGPYFNNPDKWKIHPESRYRAKQRAIACLFSLKDASAEKFSDEAGKELLMKIQKTPLLKEVVQEEYSQLLKEVVEKIHPQLSDLLHKSEEIM